MWHHITSDIVYIIGHLEWCHVPRVICSYQYIEYPLCLRRNWCWQTLAQSICDVVFIKLNEYIWYGNWRVFSYPVSFMDAMIRPHKKYKNYLNPYSSTLMPTVRLTYWSRHKMVTFCRRNIFKLFFLEKDCHNFYSNFTEIHSQRSNEQ